MKKNTAHGIVLGLAVLSLFFVLLNFITDIKLFAGLQMLSLGLMFFFQYLANKDSLNNRLSKMQLIVGMLMLSIGIVELITSYR
jgi:uncharacterized membrane protein